MARLVQVPWFLSLSLFFLGLVSLAVTVMDYVLRGMEWCTHSLRGMDADNPISSVRRVGYEHSLNDDRNIDSNRSKGNSDKIIIIVIKTGKGGKKKKEAKRVDVKQCVGDKLVAGDDPPLHDNTGDNMEPLTK